MITRLKLSFPALTHRNFRLFWLGQCISLIGTWMQNIGQAWLILKLTNSPFLLGFITTLQTLPVLFLALFAGVYVDRFPKRKLVIFTQIGLMIVAFTLSILTFSGKAQYWHIAITALILGALNSIDNPARQALMIELVGKDDLLNAIALNSSVFNLARIIGPAVAGILIGYLGIGLCFLLNGISYIAVITGLLLMDVKEKRQNSRTNATVIHDMTEGVKYVFKTPNIYVPMLLMLLINVFTMNFNVLVPVFTKIDLGMEASQYGTLMAAMGIGALTGALTLAATAGSEPKMGILFLGAAGLSLFQGILGMMHNYYLSMVFLALTGFFMITFTASCNSIIQINSEDYIRGRVMSFYTLVFSGMTTVGSMYAGTLSEHYGAGMTFLISGIIGLASAIIIYFWSKKKNIKVEEL
ncbi:MFS transporter [Tepidanaerobacter syntrophicus]|uniref:MFS transporter n=1 Tax=Tepidanaerobacter syntrophicus TaxID=224999 RepID=UPI001BD41A2E|nr:MFS transporter [Tepidanaerobacter syntrophicus]